MIKKAILLLPLMIVFNQCKTADYNSGIQNKHDTEIEGPNMDQNPVYLCSSNDPRLKERFRNLYVEVYDGNALRVDLFDRQTRATSSNCVSPVQFAVINWKSECDLMVTIDHVPTTLDFLLYAQYKSQNVTEVVKIENRNNLHYLKNEYKDEDDGFIDYEFERPIDRITGFLEPITWGGDSMNDGKCLRIR